MSYDCIIIGGGIGGLSAAGRLSSRGHKVLLVEKNPSPGGYLQSFRRKGFTFDSSVDSFSGLDEAGPLGSLLNDLGVSDEIEAIRIDPVRTSLFPGFRVDVHADIGAYEDGLKGLFPGEAPGIDSLFTDLGSIYGDIKAWGSAVVEGKGEPIPTNLLRFRGLTYEALLSSHLKDPRLKSVLSDRCPFYGLSPKRVSAVSMAALIMSYFGSGAYRVSGGSQRLADALVKGIRKNGGEVRFNEKAEKIRVEGGRAVSLKTDKGEYEAKGFISNIDFSATFRGLVGIDDGRAALGQPLPQVSSSFFILYIGARMDLSGLKGSSSIGYFPSFDMEANFMKEAGFRPDTTIGVTIPTISDTSMAPGGCHSITAHEMVEAGFTGSWKREKKALTERLLLKVEKVLPGIGNSLIHLEAATPATLERYTGNTNGAAYGWAQTPGIRPLKTFIKNLFLAGHWEGTGGGVVAAAYSGIKAANRVEGETGCVM